MGHAHDPSNPAFLGDYLEEQFRDVEARLRAGERLDAILPMKTYIQRGVARRFRELLGPGGSILEVGCGGSLILHEATRLGLKAHGADPWDVALRYSAMLRTHYGSSVELTHADGMELPFPDKSFDLVFNVGVVEHYQHDAQVQMAREMARVARRFVQICVPNPDMRSAAKQMWDNDDEVCYPCDLEAVFRAIGWPIQELDGRGLFMPRAIAEQNSPEYQSFVAQACPTAFDHFNPAGLDVLIAAEESVPVAERLIYGAAIYATARRPDAP